MKLQEADSEVPVLSSTGDEKRPGHGAARGLPDNSGSFKLRLTYVLVTCHRSDLNLNQSFCLRVPHRPARLGCSCAELWTASQSTLGVHMRRPSSITRRGAFPVLPRESAGSHYDVDSTVTVIITFKQVSLLPTSLRGPHCSCRT